MRFLIDRCAGKVLAHWLRADGHDVAESRDFGPDPGDRVLLEWASEQSRVLITIDTDFGQLVFLERLAHCGLVRLPDVRAKQRIILMQQVLTRFSDDLERGAIVTVRGGRIRVSKTDA